MNLYIPLLTACLTIFAGVITLVLGQVLVRGFLEPSLDLKREIGKIAYSVGFCANRRYSVTPENQEVTREVFRAHACRLRELNCTVGSPTMRMLLSLPGQDKIQRATSELIGHSNFPAQPDGTDADRA